MNVLGATVCVCVYINCIEMYHDVLVYYNKNIYYPSATDTQAIRFENENGDVFNNWGL